MLTARGAYSPYLPASVLTPQVAMPTGSWLLGQNVSTVPFYTDTNRWKGLGSGDVDGAGNQTRQLCAGCGTATYDGEGRLVYVPSASSAVQQARYYYDGNGRRVMKVLCPPSSAGCDAATAGAVITMFVHDVQGELAAEYSSSFPDAGRKFLFADALGSTRLYATENGATVNCYDYLPFGEEVGASYGGRPGCYGTASYPGVPGVVSEKFTGKERDSETGLDYFGARYLSSAQGRLTSPDTSLVDQNPDDPQSWNLYSYVRNNPLSFTDPTGNDCVYVNSGGTGIVSIDNQGTSTQCGKSGGYWVDGTVTNARFAHGSLILSGTTDGTNRTSASYGLTPTFGDQFINEMGRRQDVPNRVIGIAATPYVAAASAYLLATASVE